MSLAILSRLDKIEKTEKEILEAIAQTEEPVCEAIAAQKMGISVRTLQNKRYLGCMAGTFIKNKAGVYMYYMSKVNSEI